MSKADRGLFEDLWAQWQTETEYLCKIQTWRGTSETEPQVKTNLMACRQYIFGIATDFNNTIKHHKLVPFQWCMKGETTKEDPSDEDILSSDFWVFGFRVGPDSAENKLALICHLDTVPATENEEWKPFDPVVREREYPGGTVSPQDFLVCRGGIDDKGPAASAFLTVRGLVQTYDESDVFSNTQLELIFDTSEETNMSTPKYMAASPRNPDFGVVYDAMWIVRAEKGGERPKFFVDAPTSAPSDSKLYISSLISSPDNSCNTIPDWAEARICGDSASLDAFLSSVQQDFQDFEYDDPAYHRGTLDSRPIFSANGSLEAVVLKIGVEGAQHGSAPDENREKGVNPFVSLANFLGGLSDQGRFEVNGYTSMTKFIKWTWGTYAFGEGENTKDVLYKFDDIFQEGNGTTYAVTKLSTTKVTDKTAEEIKLEIDIRYALPHHKEQWDGVTEGELEGASTFSEDFGDLVMQFNKENPNEPSVRLETDTIFGPDIRDPEQNENYQKAIAAYMNVMKEKPKLLAIGGGTDAKGITTLIAMGPLFDTRMGMPISYHGINEGAPIIDMKRSTEILYNVFAEELESPSHQGLGKREKQTRSLKAVAALDRLHARGRKHCCSR
ncbi:hypothetical protein BWQ96_03785 [Gracilariopsis chorda]|uniref:Uncharacterized protein n=1 Tax=Gracilariopsis chorda TaxID=448386 RepID=A0A2V3IZA4_9FLOR|nr:hypothetical protein BWQ96_03785 [Gracilariopsis chorda]|eukprot:PXF46460.1 hypothetical protein BWQ96_03785 [Gracilariopsis chorda]